MRKLSKKRQVIGFWNLNEMDLLSQPFFQSNGFINIKSEDKKVSVGVDVCGLSYISATDLN